MFFSKWRASGDPPYHFGLWKTRKNSVLSLLLTSFVSVSSLWRSNQGYVSRIFFFWVVLRLISHLRKNVTNGYEWVCNSNNTQVVLLERIEWENWRQVLFSSQETFRYLEFFGRIIMTSINYVLINILLKRL